jgi:hypothetical protein
MKKIIYMIVLLVSLGSPSTFAENNDLIQAQLSYPSSSAAFNYNAHNIADADQMAVKKSSELPSFFGLIGLAVVLGFIGFRMKGTTQ